MGSFLFGLIIIVVSILNKSLKSSDKAKLKKNIKDIANQALNSNVNTKNRNNINSEIEKLNQRMNKGRQKTSYYKGNVNSYGESRHLVQSEVLESNLIWENEKRRIKMQNDLFNQERQRMHENNRRLMQECKNVNR